MKIKELFMPLFIIIMAMIFGFSIGYNVSNEYVYVEPYGYNFKLELLNAYDNYYDNAENVINITAPLSDTLPSNIYSKYIDSKNTIDSLFNTQL